MRNMISGMFSLRAGVRAGRLLVRLSRSGCNLRLSHLRCLIALCLKVLTVHLFRVVLRSVVRERADSAVFSTLSKGSMFVAIWRAVSGLTPRGMNPGSATPDRCAVAAVEASTALRSLFLDGWNPSRILFSQFEMARCARSLCCVSNHVRVAAPEISTWLVWSNVVPVVGGSCPLYS